MFSKVDINPEVIIKAIEIGNKVGIVKIPIVKNLNPNLFFSIFKIN